MSCQSVEGEGWDGWCGHAPGPLSLALPLFPGQLYKTMCPIRFEKANTCAGPCNPLILLNGCGFQSLSGSGMSAFARMQVVCAESYMYMYMYFIAADMVKVRHELN